MKTSPRTTVSRQVLLQNAYLVCEMDTLGSPKRNPKMAATRNKLTRKLIRSFGLSALSKNITK